MKCYTVFKQTATHADVLAAIGAADVLRHLEPRIVDLGDRFEVHLRRGLLPSDLDAVDPGFSYLERRQKNAPRLPPERIMRTRPAHRSLDDAIAGVTVAENRMYSILGRMKAYGGPNRVTSRFARMKREAWERRVWECLHGRPDFVFSSPLVQLFNPHAAKGYALLKPSGTNRGDRTKDRWAQPFVEWLRFRGYFEGSAGWFTSGDLRLFCPIPGDISYDKFAATAAAFRQLRLGGSAPKIDCLAVLRLTRLLIENAERYRRPRQWLHGVWVTHYKDMGQAHTLMAMEQLAIPDWFELRTSQQAQLWCLALQEHDTVVRRLTDSHSDEFALIKQYRRTLQTRWEESIAEFVEFLMGYGMLLFKRRAQDYWALPQFTISGVTSILRRDPDLWTVIRNPGFLAVAAAIRSSTVGAQGARRNGKLDHREIRYGLLREIRQAGLLGRRNLFDAVSTFISEFNRESARRRSMGLPAADIRDSELGAFRALLERLPPSVPAGSLLCGLSTCRRGTVAAVEIEPRTCSGNIGMIQSLSLCAEVTLALHNLNSEGNEGNQQQTRMVHVIDAAGNRHCVNAVSGDMFKHIYVQHLTAVLEAQGQALSQAAAAGSPDRITVDNAFKNAIKGRSAAEVQTEMLVRCAVTDVAGTLFTEGITVPRKSCAEFGWVVGIPNKVHTQQYFHVKFEPDRRKAASHAPRGEGTTAGSQTVFHRPANSGVYGLICHLELSRIGVNDVTRQPAIAHDARVSRQRAAVQALLATLIKPAGAQCNTQSPHILECLGVLTTSSSYLPAPMLSPLSERYREDIGSIAETLNRLTPGAVAARSFDGMASAVEMLERIAMEL